jgi:hypothetical protein
VCPVGQFNFIASTVSPLELAVREPAVCQSCTTVDCIRGRRSDASQDSVVQRGCELGYFLTSKTCNIYYVSIAARVPGVELAFDSVGWAIGRLSRRTDLAVLAVLFTFGAVLNAFAMTAPVHALERSLARTLGTSSESIVLGLIFAAGLVVVPLALCAGAGSVTRLLAAPSPLDVRHIAVRYAYAFVPLGVGLWLAHYGFHFLTAAGTIVPVAQQAAIEASGRALLGEPDWSWLGMRPGSVFALQLGAVLLGAAGSVALAHRIGERDHDGRALRAAAPWTVVIVGLALLAMWILMQPMEMRGTGLG